MADNQTSGMKLSLIVQAIDRVTAPLRKINDKIAKVTGGMAEKISRPFIGVRNALAGLVSESGVPKLASAFAGVGRAAGSVVKQVGLIGAGVASVAALTVGGLFKMAISASNAGDALAKLADRTGLSVNALREYQFVAGRAGIEQEEFNRYLEQFNKRLGQAKVNTGALYSFLGDVSPKLLAQAKAAKTNEEALDLMFRAMARIKDDSKRAAFADAVFGKGASKLSNMVKNGVTEISELRAEARRILGDQEKFARQSEEFNDMWGDLVASIEGVRNAFIGELFPALSQLTVALREIIIEYREPIREWAAEFAGELPGYIRDLVKGFKDLRAVVGPVIGAISRAVGMFGGLKGVALVLAAVLGGKLLWSIGLLIKSLGLLGGAMTMTPAGLFLLAVGAIAAAAWLVYDNWEDIADFFERIWSRVKLAFSGVIDFLRGVFTGDFQSIYIGFGKIVDAFGGSFSKLDQAFRIVGDSILRVFDGLFSGVREKFDAAIAFIQEKIAWLMNAADWISRKVNSVLPGGASPAGAGMFGAAGANMGASLALGARGAKDTQARVTVDFENVPRGTKISKDPRSTAPLDLSAGYAMQEAF